jgi:carbonic anhydrase
MVFDQGLGDLLVTRTAGHVLDDAVLGSIEYGVAALQAVPVLVLGHQACGAVAATLEVVESGAHAEGNVADLVAAIRPAVERTSGSGAQRIAAIVDENVRLVTKQVAADSVVAGRLTAGQVRVVGARYGLGTGLVHVLTP